MRGLKTIIGDGLEAKTGSRCPFHKELSDPDTIKLHNMCEELILHWENKTPQLKEVTKKIWTDQHAKEEQELEETISTFSAMGISAQINKALQDEFHKFESKKGNQIENFEFLDLILKNSRVGTGIVVGIIIRFINDFYEKYKKLPTSNDIRKNQQIRQISIGLAWSPGEISERIRTTISGQPSEELGVFDFSDETSSKLSDKFIEKAEKIVQEEEINRKTSLCAGKKRIPAFERTITAIFLTLYEEIKTKYENPTFIYR